MKKNRIRLTESQLHKVIKECVKKVLKEERAPRQVQILDTILDGYKAEEMADEMNTDKESAAANYFKEIYYEGNWSNQSMPKYSQYICDVDSCEMYYDYGADYYFLVDNGNNSDMTMEY